MSERVAYIKCIPMLAVLKISDACLSSNKLVGGEKAKSWGSFIIV